MGEYKNGKFYPDNTPVAMPARLKRESGLNEIVRQMVRSERLAQEAEEAGFETFEEADDFEVEDYDPSSPYEMEFEGLPVKELKAKLAAEADRSPPPGAPAEAAADPPKKPE